MSSQQHLTSPNSAPVHFERNFLQQVVCELRFPTLFELEGPRPPLSLSQALRKEYPLYQASKDLNVSAGGVAQSHVHVFKSRRSDWTVLLRASAITLETTRYTSFEDFEKRIAFIMKAAEKIIDSDFFTRVGLRYINSLPCAAEDAQDWLNPALVGLLGSAMFNGAEEYSQRVSGPAAFGSYLFSHGLGINNATKNHEYLLDIDFSSEDISFADAMAAIKKLHEQEYAMFDWALGKKAREHLGPSTLLVRR